MSGTTDKISGNIKQTTGKLTDNQKLQAKGKAQELKGKTKNAINKVV